MHLDYCNLLLFGISDNLLQRLQQDIWLCYRFCTSWTHHTSLVATSLAASTTAHWTQACSFHLRSAEWPVSAILGRWMLIYRYYPPPTTSSSNDRRSLIHCCWTASMEQPTSPPMGVSWSSAGYWRRTYLAENHGA